jgi:predicted DNA-binding transcriptional regulator YafY
MRYQPSERLLQLALEMQSSRMGVSLPDIESQFRCSRRTAQRMRDAVVRAYPQVEAVVDSERRPRWRIPAGGVVTPGVVTADELADLEATIKLLRQQNQRRRADALQMVLQKLRATLPQKLQTRLAPDIEALLEAEGLAMRPGPRPTIRPDVIDTIRLAIKQGRELYLAYRGRRTGRSSGRRLQPLGFIFGNRHYLVGIAPEKPPAEPRLYALSGVSRVSVTERAFQRDPGFSLQRFAERAFGVFQDEPRDIVWQFSPDVAAAVREYNFHPTQKLEKQRDGSVIVRFHAGGLLEMCWHLYTWGKSVTVLEPPELQHMMKRASQHTNYRLD